MPKKILVRLPNWLGDVIMSIGVLQAIHKVYGTAQIDIIIKKELNYLVPFIPYITQHYSFDKQVNKGLWGAYIYGKQIKKNSDYDLLICLPNSLSSAVMSNAIGATISIGYKSEGRNFLFTKAFNQNKNIHRTESYINLLEQYTEQKLGIATLTLQHTHLPKKNTLIVNINSEAQSRKLPITKAISLLNAITNATQVPILLIGSPNDVPYVTQVYKGLQQPHTIHNLAGTTTIPQLIAVLQTSVVMLSTDSGPAHIANALGVPTIVLFGAGNEAITAPYNNNTTTLRLGKLPCEKCVKNICNKYELPECLLQLNNEMIVNKILEKIIEA